MKNWKTTIALIVACFCGGELAAHDQLEIQIMGTPESIYDSGIPRLTIPITRDAAAFNFSKLNGFWSDESDQRWNNLWKSLKVILPYGLTNLTTLRISSSKPIRALFLPEDLTNLRTLLVNGLPNFQLPDGLVSLENLYLRDNNLSSFHLSKDFAGLKTLELSNNSLGSFTLPEGFGNLRTLDLGNNPLSSLLLPKDLTRLEALDLGGTQIRHLTLPEGLANLKVLNLPSSLEQLTVPHGMDIYRLVPNPSFRIISYHLEIRRSGNGLEVSWSGGVLQTSASVNGPW